MVLLLRTSCNIEATQYEARDEANDVEQQAEANMAATT